MRPFWTRPVTGRDMMKRLLDIVVSLSCLALFAPLLSLIALMIGLTLGSPILFRQVRPGRHCRPFTVVKFRTMTDAVGPDGQLLDDVRRLTRLGRLLRMTSLDELPQLFNVLRGDMSLVGPRPLLMEYLPLYTPEQARRHEVRPGITGWAQVHGRNATNWGDRLAMDVWYVDHRSLLLDFRILWLTLRTIVSGRGINHAGHATMPKFTGNGKHGDA